MSNYLAARIISTFYQEIAQLACVLHRAICLLYIVVKPLCTPILPFHLRAQELDGIIELLRHPLAVFAGHYCIAAFLATILANAARTFSFAASSNAFVSI